MINSTMMTSAVPIPMYMRPLSSWVGCYATGRECPVSADA